jgi:broad specificity phosphatase PhoE
MTIATRRGLGLALGALLLVSCNPAPPPPAPAAAPSTLFLVRHAEKAGEEGDVPLTEAGAARARELARVLGEAGVRQIYTTQYQRNVDTAKPLAEKLGIAPMVIPADNVEELVERLKATPPGEAALVVSHTDKLPMIGEKLGIPFPAVAHTEYDRLTVVTLVVTAGQAKADARILRFGQPPAP